ncbi:uncharacterized protein LOC111630844 [Centruroides sculpturatus]|uniref:uncharacterized protein LOC111630844 n=1 Tax=Centruroides sculpturatus TaxID=218467 RepID=UPI000C6DD385|nr:uncharacterized protein LOC111630844 [Centruroides sculpturatus]
MREAHSDGRQMLMMEGEKMPNSQHFLFSVKREKIQIDECTIDVELKCTEIIIKNGTADCKYKVWRGSSLSLIFKADNYEDRSFPAISGPHIFAFGIPIPQEMTLDMKQDYTEAYIHYAKFPIGRIIGLELFALTSGDIDILVLKPVCLDTKYCIYYESCYDNCNTYENSDEYCIVNYTLQYMIQTSCTKSVPHDVSFEIKFKKTISVDIGYNSIDIDELIEVEPGDIVGFSSKTSIIPSTSSFNSDEFVDTDKNGNSLDVRHYFRVFATEPVEYHMKYTFNELGTYNVTAETSCSNTGSVNIIKKEILVFSDFGYFNVSVHPTLIAVGDKYTIKIITSGGIDIDLVWDYKNGTTEQEFISSIPPLFSKDIVCLEKGDHTIEIIASNDNGSVSDIVTFTCIYPVTDDWKLKSDSPQCIPPGNITFTLTYPEGKYFPTDGIARINYGADNTFKNINIPTTGTGAWETSFEYTYRYLNEYNVTMIIENEISDIYLTLNVTLNQCFVNFTVKPKFVPNEKSDLQDAVELIGPYSYDAPIDRPFYFEMQPENEYYDYFLVDYSNGTLVKNSSEKLINFKFNEVGIYDFSFYLIYGNGKNGPVNKTVRILDYVKGLHANDTNNGFCDVERGANVTIYIEQYDEYSCLLIDAQDGSVPVAFGDEDVCIYSYNDAFNHEGKIPSSNMMYYHQFEEEGDFDIKVEIFNSISKEIKEVGIGCEMAKELESIVKIVSAKRTCKKPAMWLRSQAINLHSVTIFNLTERYRYFREWKIFEADANGHTLRELDTSLLRKRESECLYIPPRYFEIGLYKVTVFITIKKLENNGDFLYMGNGSDHTCLKINYTPFGVRILEDGTSYIKRGVGQLIYMNPLNFSVDPDNPDNMLTYLFLLGSIILDQELYFDTKWLWGPNITYKISAVLQNENKTARGHLQIELIEEISPPITLRCRNEIECNPLPDSFILNPPRSVEFQARCEGTCRDATKILYEWEIIMRNYETGETIILTNYSDIVYVYHQRLAVTELFYELYPKYLFINVTVKAYIQEYEVIGFAKLILRINRPPTAGNCKLKPETGYALIENYIITCSDWSDPDELPLKGYYVYSQKNNDFRYLLWSGVSTNTVLVLPYGLLDIYVSAVDHYGAETTIFVHSIKTLLPSKDEFKQWNETRSLELAFNNSDINRVTQIILAYVSVFMEYNENVNLNKPPFEDKESKLRREIRINQTWDKYKNLTGIDSSYTTIQARNEIAEMIEDANNNFLELAIKKNNEVMKSLLSLPIVTVEDSMVISGAFSMLSMDAPMNKEGLV